MKSIISIYKKLVFAIVFISGIVFTSCTDYLTIIPPSVVVHEDFWKNEAEVNGMVANAYLKLSENASLRNAIVWGETRAETVDRPLGGSNESLNFLLEGMLYDDNSYSSWSNYYSAINYCNLVLEFAPTVMEKDPNFSQDDMTIVEGQMKALRAYAHFVLLRAFCNIPMSMKAVINDAEIPEYPQVHPMEALKTIYADLEEASTKVLRSGENGYDKTGYVTTNAVYAMMADVNMWQAAFATYYNEEGTYTPELTPDGYYDLAIANCDKVLRAMEETYKEHYYDKNSPIKNEKDTCNLLQNVENPTDNNAIEMCKKGYSPVYEAIFGHKNSREAIFEFQIDDANHAKSNGISSAFGANGNSGGLYVVQENFLENTFEDDDLRKYAFVTTSVPDPNGSSSDGGASGEVTELYVAKFTAKTTPNEYGDDNRTYRSGDEYDANWIVYRQTEVMLTLAEALLSRSNVSAEDVKVAFRLTNAINSRWRMDPDNIENELVLEDYLEPVECLELVRQERVRELCFEGRRWYDIVRLALQTPQVERAAKTSFSYNSKRHGVDSEEMARRYNHISAYFMPIDRNEIRFNKLLEQNKSCRTSENSEIEQN